MTEDDSSTDFGPKTVRTCSGRIGDGNACKNEVEKSEHGIYLGHLCKNHARDVQRRTFVQAEAFNYNLLQVRLKDRVRGFATSSQAKNVREEIGVLRLLLEEKLNKLNLDSAYELEAAITPISQLVTRIESLVITCSKQEEKLDLTLDKNDLVLIGQRMVELISLETQKLNLPDEQSQAFLESIVNGLEAIVISRGFTERPSDGTNKV